MTTPERDAVTRAREAVLQGVVDQMNAALRAVGSDAEAVLETNRSTNLDAYAAAVRQQALADAVRVVESVPSERASQLSGAMIQRNPASLRRDILTAIRTLAQETTDGR